MLSLVFLYLCKLLACKVLAVIVITGTHDNTSGIKVLMLYLTQCKIKTSKTIDSYTTSCAYYHDIHSKDGQSLIT